MIVNTVKITNACLNAMVCFAWCICWYGLLASTFKSTQRTSMWPGSPKDSTTPSEEPECSQARRVTQSDPRGLEPHQDHATLDRAFSAAIILLKLSCKTYIPINRNACVHDTCCKRTRQSDFLG